ncbi:hypothetical protein BH24ACT5_BH24ACT5_32000 [soil metagenome]
MDLDRRGRSMAELGAELQAVATARGRVAELVAHVVGAHAAGLERLVDLADDPRVVEDDPELSEVLYVHRPDGGDSDHVDRYGNRIDALLSAIEQSATPAVAATASALVAEVSDLYGAALARAFALLHDSGQHDTIRRAIDDDLVASLLVVHGLHPQSIDERVRACLADLAETLPEHGGRVSLLGIDDDGLVRIEITDGSEIHRWRTRLAAERAIERAAPDHGGIEVIGPPAEVAAITTFIPLGAVRRSAHGRTARRWVEFPELAEVAPDTVRRIESEGIGLVACNIGGDLFVALDPFGDDESVGAIRVVAHVPPTVESAAGRRVVLDAPFPVQRSDQLVEVLVS